MPPVTDYSAEAGANDNSTPNSLTRMGFCVLADSAATWCHNGEQVCLSIHQPLQRMWLCRSQRKKIRRQCCLVGGAPRIAPIEPVVAECRGVYRESTTATKAGARALAHRKLTPLPNPRQQKAPARRCALPMARSAPAATSGMLGRKPPDPLVRKV